MVEQRFSSRLPSDLKARLLKLPTLSQPAQEIPKVQTSQPSGSFGGDGIANRQIVQTAFSAEVLEEAANSGAYRAGSRHRGGAAVKEDHNKPKEQPLEQVAANIRERLAAEKRPLEEAQKRGEVSLIAELREGRTSSAAGSRRVEAAPAARKASIRTAPGGVPYAASECHKGQPSLSGVTLANGDIVDPPEWRQRAGRRLSPTTEGHVPPLPGFAQRTADFSPSFVSCGQGGKSEILRPRCREKAALRGLSIPPDERPLEAAIFHGGISRRPAGPWR